MTPGGFITPGQLYLLKAIKTWTRHLENDLSREAGTGDLGTCLDEIISHAHRLKQQLGVPT